MATTAGDIAKAAVPVVGSVLDAAFTNAQNKKQREWNERMYDRQFKDQYALWTEANAYNHPSEVMKRYREAELNPNLIYGNGTNATADVMKTPGVESWKPEAPQLNLGGLGTSIASFQDTRVKEAQTDNLREQNKLTQAATAEKLLDIDMKNVDKQYQPELKHLSLEAAKEQLNILNEEQVSKNVDNAFKVDTYGKRVDTVTDQLNELQARIRNINQDTQGKKTATASTELDKKLKQIDIDLRGQGLNPSDPMYMRLLLKAAQKLRLL